MPIMVDVTKVAAIVAQVEKGDANWLINVIDTTI